MSNTKAPPPAVGWLFPLYLLVIFVGYICLRLPGAMSNGQEMGAIRALFSSVNAATLTGFPQTIDIDKYQPLGQAAIFALFLCGSLFSLILGATAVTRILRLNYSDLQICLAALTAQTAAILVGGFFLLFDHDRTLWQAVFMAASAFANCGLVVGPAPTAWQTHLVLLPLIIAGGLGLLALIELANFFRNRTDSLSPQTTNAITSAAWLYIAGTIALVALGLWAGVYSPDEPDANQALRDLVSSSATASVASRTAGMNLLSVEHLSRPAVWIVLLLMAIGGSTAGTAGGIKTSTIAALCNGVRRSYTDQPVSRAFAIAASWLAGYCALVLVAILLLLHLMPQTPGDRVLFTAVSAASNVGLTYEPLSPDPGAAYALCSIMLAGRIFPWIVLWWHADMVQSPDVPQREDPSPDSQLAVG